MTEEFWDGFRKEAGIKELALAGLLASTPVAAKAGQSTQAQKHVMKALQKQFSGKIKGGKQMKALATKAKSVNLGGKASGSGKVSIKDLQRVEYKKGKFTGALSPEELKANLNIGKGLDLEGKAKHSGEQFIGMRFKKDF